MAATGFAPSQKFSWKQSEDEKDLSLELTIDLGLPVGSRPSKEIAVLVKEGEVLCVRHKDAVVVQWRLYSPIEEEVEWRIEEGKLVLDITKKEGDSWPCLLRLPLIPTDRALKSVAELDALLQTEMLPLPGPLGEQPPAVAKDETDPDAILEEALTEAQELDSTVAAEMRGKNEELEELRTKQREIKEQLETCEADKRAEFQRKSDIVDKMVAICLEIHEVRCKPASLESFRRIQMLDIRKSRLNIGIVDEFETEAFADSDEDSLTDHELFTVGVQALQQNNTGAALHFLRLAAIHRKHPLSTCLLHRLYCEMGVVCQAAYFLVQHANLEECDASTNFLAAELFDRGMRHFPPMMALAVHYYQRAARAGSVHAMISLAQIFNRGGCSATFASETVREKNKDVDMFAAWLDHAEARGAGSAMFVKGTLHLRGESGFEKSYVKAREYLERSAQCQPEFTRKVAMMEPQLEALRAEQGVSKPAAAPKPSSKPAAPAKEPTPVSREQPVVNSASARLNALEARTTDPNAFMEKAKPVKATRSLGSTQRRVFWERAARTGTLLYALYSVLFPLRVLLLPHFYTIVASVMEMLGGAFSSGGAAPARGRML